VTKQTTPWELYKEFFFGKFTQKLPDFEAKQKLKVVRFLDKVSCFAPGCQK
jgi:hypothetical protein